MTSETIAFWSGHANSSAMCLRMKEIGIAPDLIVHASTGPEAEFPGVYEFMEKFEKIVGIPVVVEDVTAKNPGKIFDAFFNKPWIRTAKCHGAIHGFPIMGGRCWHRDNVKRPVFTKYDKIAKETYVGFTTQEIHRTRRDTSGPPLYRYPLIEWGWSAEDSISFLRKRDIPHPLYDKGFKRLGCWFCPNQNDGQLYLVFLYYPELWEKLLDYEDKSPYKFRGGKSSGKRTLYELQEIFEKKKQEENK
jgi:3'-phosphoadenosine 5'-phosphosulfate sulfotransferase (PAPS reductase)/FAD synthetase